MNAETQWMTTVLVVDDDPHTRELLTHILTKAGITVMCAANALEAIDLIGHAEPDGVLLDALMPGMDGFELCARLRSDHPHLPILFMTGLDETDDIVKGFESGANDYLAKPLVAPEVIARLRAHMRVAGLVKSTREAVNASETPLIALMDDRLIWSNAAVVTLLGQKQSTQAAIDARLQRCTAQLQHHLATGPVDRPTAFEFDAAGLTIKARLVAPPSHGVAIFALGLGVIRTLPSLTPREAEVLMWVAHGKTNRDIADILSMSPRTVNKHLEHIYQKLGVETRTAAASLARGGGVLFGID